MPSFSECGISPVCWAKGWLAGGVKAVAESVVDMVASAIATATESVLSFMAKALVSMGGANVGASPSVSWLQSSLHWLTSILALVSVLAAGGMMIWHQRGSPVRDLARSLATLVVVSAAGVTAINLATTAADQFSSWLLSRSDGMETLAGNMTLFLAAAGGLGAFLIIILGLCSIVGGLIQVGLLIVRTIFLQLMAGVFPLSASATNTDWGRQWFQKSVSWIVAFVAYKPTVAIIFSFGLRMLKTSGVDVKTLNEKIKDICNVDNPTSDDYAKCIEKHPKEFSHLKSDLMENLTGFLQGLIFLLLSVLALSAIMKFIVPAVGALSSGSGGALMGAAGAAGGMAIAGGSQRASRGGSGAPGAEAPGGGGGAAGMAGGSAPARASSGPPGGSAGPPGSSGSPASSGPAGASSGRGSGSGASSSPGGGRSRSGPASGASAAAGGVGLAVQAARGAGRVAGGARDAAAGQTGESNE